MRFLRWLKPARRTRRFDEEEAAYTVFDQLDQRAREAFASIDSIALLYTTGRQVDAKEVVWSGTIRTNLNELRWENMPAGVVDRMVCYNDRGRVVRVQRLTVAHRLYKGDTFIIPVRAIEIEVRIA
jgi:hypothetical protein